ncbi:hypothetical protein [Allomuricauda sp. R78024]|uniref:hypothetical protein n=1 Tax=Allomuricauda sp. R78024 TaxID=3093867 RepID=UPI0037C8C14B
MIFKVLGATKGYGEFTTMDSLNLHLEYVQNGSFGYYGVRKSNTVNPFMTSDTLTKQIYLWTIQNLK